MTVADNSGTVGAEQGELIIVGTGYRAIGDLTLQAQSYIRAADRVLHLLSDPLCADHIARLNPNAESLMRFYERGKPRHESYQEMSARILDEVQKGRLVCAVFYGHPGVFVAPSHLAIKQAKAAGLRARMLPAVSAEDWIFADLGIDPGREGCHCFEASDFLLHSRIHDPTSLLILWQVGVIGMIDWSPEFNPRPGAQVLVEVMTRSYSSEHEVIIYEASPYEVCQPRIERLPLVELPEIKLTACSTLVVPPATRRRVDLDMAKRIGFALPEPQ
ncbi:MAG: hypothetical protein JO287_20230 [Pseudonocardiales bacterium]|nr:hypothetical protein [Pseudonocardiales bacterium]